MVTNNGNRAPRSTREPEGHCGGSGGGFRKLHQTPELSLEDELEPDKQKRERPGERPGMSSAYVSGAARTWGGWFLDMF